jgi:hypothetical protein
MLDHYEPSYAQFGAFSLIRRICQQSLCVFSISMYPCAIELEEFNKLGTTVWREISVLLGKKLARIRKSARTALTKIRGFFLDRQCQSALSFPSENRY